MSIQIEYNNAIEFVNALTKYATNIGQSEWKPGKGDIPQGDVDFSAVMDFTPSIFIKNWITDVDQNISAFMKNDIKLLFNQFYIFIPILTSYITDNHITTGIQLIENLKAQDPEALINRFLKYINVPNRLRNDRTAVIEFLTDDFNREVSTIFEQLYHNPKEFILKVCGLMDYFYNIHFSIISAEIEALIEPKRLQHQATLDENPLQFLNIIGLGNYKTVVDEKRPITLYISYILDIGLSYFTQNGTLYMIYGVNMERRFDQQLMREKCRNLFKALSDERRIEILKLTNQRPYYNKELADHFGLTTATLSYHINLLLDIGLLHFEPKPNNRYYYSTNKEALEKAFEMGLEMLLE